VSRVAASLGDKVEQLRKAPVIWPIPYLFLDAVFLDAWWARKVENVSALVAYGIGMDGKRQLLAVTIGAEESEGSWRKLLAQLIERGLAGVQHVIADRHLGIASAVRKHLPEVPQQRCTVHLQRNVPTTVPQRLRSRLGKRSPRSSRRRPRPRQRGVWTRPPPAWVGRCPRPSSASGRALRQPPSFIPSRESTGTGSGRPTASSCSTARSSAGPGRWVHFPDRASALRLVTAVALRVTAIWTDRRCLDMSLLKPKEVIEAKAA